MCLWISDAPVSFAAPRGAALETEGHAVLRDYLQLPRPIYVLCLGMLLNRAGAFFVVFLTIYLRDQLGFSIGFATLVIGASGFGSMLGSIVGGQLADQIGRRSVMALAMIGSALMLVALSMVRQPVPFLLGVMLFSMLGSTYRPAASAMIGDLVVFEKRQFAFGLIYISINLGFAIAPPLGGLLAEYSWQWLFWIDAVTSCLFGMVILTCIQETLPASTRSLNVAVDLPSSDDASERSQATDEPQVSVRDATQQMLTDSPFVLFCLATFFSTLVFVQAFATLPITMMGLGMTPAEYGHVIAINGVMIVLLQLPLTSWLSRYERMYVIAVGSLLVGLGFGLNIFASTVGFAALTIAVWTMGEMFHAPFMQAVVTDLAPVKLRGRYLGVFGMFYALAMTIGAPLGGQILETYGARALWMTCFWIGLAAVGLFLLVSPSVRRRAQALVVGTTVP